MVSFTRRGYLSAIAGLGIGSTVLSGVGQSEEFPLVGTAPQLSATHSLDMEGRLTVSTDSAIEGNLVAVVATFPEIEAIKIFHLDEELPRGTVELKYCSDTLPNNRGLTFLFYDDRNQESVSQWDYLGETAPFEQTSDGRFERAIHAVEYPATTSGETLLKEDGFQEMDVERNMQSGKYTMQYQARIMKPPNVSDEIQTISLDIGKSAYARATEGTIRNHATVFENGLDSLHVENLLTLIQAEIEKNPSSKPEYELFRTIVQFVQSLPYIRDMKSAKIADYAKKPVETLVEAGCDCEDSAILMAALFEQSTLECEPLFLLIPQHAAIAVRMDSIPPDVGIGESTFVYDGIDYAYIETTNVTKVGVYPAFLQDFSKSDGLAIYQNGNWSNMNPHHLIDKEEIREWLPQINRVASLNL